MSAAGGGDLRLVLVAPFATGWTLDAQRLLHEGWGDAQRTVSAGVEAAAAAREGWATGWTSSADRDRRYTDFAHELADQLHAEVPQAFVGCGGKPLLDHVVATHAPLAGLTALKAAATFTPRDVSAGIADFGVGVITIEYDVQLAAGVSAEGYRAQVATLGSTVAPLFDALVPDVLGPLDAYLSSDAGRALCRLVVSEEAGPVDATVGRTMWAHVIHVVGAPDPDGCRERVDRWQSVLPPTHEQVCDSAETDHVVFRPGLGTSLAVHTPAGAEHATVLTRVVALQTLYYVGAASIDRQLFERLNALALDTRAGRARSLMRGSVEIRELYERAELFRSVVANLDLHLAASTAWEVRAWGCLARVWRLDRRLESIDRKLEALQRLYARVTGELAADRSYALTLVVFVFTAIATTSTVLAAIDFTQSDALSSPDGARGAIVVALVVLVVVLVAAAMAWANRPMKRKGS